MMAETCLLAEYAICYPPLYDDLRSLQPRPTATPETLAIAAVAAASEQQASAILVLSTSGNTARLISKYRPKVPIITSNLTNSRPSVSLAYPALAQLPAVSKPRARSTFTEVYTPSGTQSHEELSSTSGKLM